MCAPATHAPCPGSWYVCVSAAHPPPGYCETNLEINNQTSNAFQFLYMTLAINIAD